MSETPRSGDSVRRSTREARTTESDGYCNDHGIRYERLDGYDRCPKCRLEEDADAREREMMERRADPNMHPTVDAPRR